MVKTLTISKDPQCRHNERLFVTYTSAVTNGITFYTAHCSNCGSASAAAYADKERARADLMKVEAKPLTGGGFTP